MDNLKKQLKNYLLNNGRSEPLVDIYNMFPYHGHDLTNRQKGDRVRSVWRKLQRNGFKSDAKILIFDIETSPLPAWVWSCWKQNVHPTSGQLQGQVMMLSWSAKWLYENKVYNDYMRPNEITESDDLRVVNSLYHMLDEADIIVAHNGKKFDVKVFNTRCLVHGITPTSQFHVIDTYLHAKKRFRLESNKLDYLAQVLGFGNKLKTSFSLWERCMKGDEEAMSYMVKYCDEDVRLLEGVYLKMRPWITPHPNVNLIVGETEELACPSCGSNEVSDNGFYRTYTQIYQAHKCDSCGSTFRSRKSIKMNKEGLTVTTGS
jgi:predicted RNA-binding Zn-ribbon protein involved in translation (DUF1610 family)